MCYSITLFMNSFFIIIFFNYLKTQSIWWFCYIIKFSKFLNFENFIILQIKKLQIS